jgi:hypothetical protein
VKSVEGIRDLDTLRQRLGLSCTPEMISPLYRRGGGSIQHLLRAPSFFDQAWEQYRAQTASAKRMQ